MSENTSIPDPYAGLIVEIDPIRKTRILTFEGKHYAFVGTHPLCPGIEVLGENGTWDMGADCLHTYIPMHKKTYQAVSSRLIRVERGANWEPSE